MVIAGAKVAVFTAIEVKSEKGLASEPQLNFLTELRNDGGIAEIARSVEEASLAVNLKRKVFSGTEQGRNEETHV